MQDPGAKTIKMGANTAERLGLAQLYSSRTAPTSGWSDMSGREHFVQFYKDDGFIINSIAEFVIHGLKSRDNCIVVATGEHIAGIEKIINTFSNGIETARSEGRYIVVDAADTLAQIMRGEMPDANLFLDVIGSLVSKAASNASGLRIYGEMVGLLCTQQNYAAAIRLEEMWNTLKKDYQFSLFCGYQMGDLDNETAAKHMALICSTHTKVIPDETYTSLTNADERLKAIAILQQKSIQLEAEVAELERRILLKQPDLKAA